MGANEKWFGITRRNCRGGRYEASIYSKAYTEGPDPFELWRSGLLSADVKSEFGLCGAVGGMMVIELLACTTRRGRGGIAAVEDMRQAYIVKHIRKSLTLLG